MRKMLIAGVIVATAITAAVTPVAANVPRDTAETTRSVDPDYEYSVVDVESAGTVRERAQQVLGDRFVEIWVTPDQLSYSVGVHNLEPSEKTGFEDLISGKTPVTIVDRPVSRAELDQFAEEIGDITNQLESTISSYGLDYEAGVVLISTSESQFDEVAEDLEEHSNIVVRTEDDRTVMTSDGVAISGYSEPQVVVVTTEHSEEEGASENPYRAGKYISVGGSKANCTASFTVLKDSKRYGLTAGHCGKNSSSVTFAGTSRGAITSNTLWAASPAVADASIFRMEKNSTAVLYRSSTINRDVTGKYKTSDLVKGFRVCTRGAFTADQSCGPISQVNVTTYSDTANRNVKNGYKWTWDPYGTKKGDSGAPVYRVQSDGSVKAVGVHRSGNTVNSSTFTPIDVVLKQTGTTLVTR